MKRYIWISGLLLLACGGMTEQIIEGVTGEEITFSEDGFESTLPNDGRVSIQWGEGVQHSDALVFEPPPDGTLEISGLVTFPDQPESHFVIYQTPADKDTIAAQYRQQLEGMGMTVEEKQQEGDALVLKAAQGELTYIVAIESDTENVTRVTLGQGSESALEEGMNANPM
jgi:hypothetical protein